MFKVELKKDGLEGKELAFMTGLESSLNTAFAEAKKDTIDPITFAQKIKEISDKIVGKGLTDEQLQTFNETVESVKAHAIEIQKHKDAGIKGASNPALRMSIKQQLEAYIKANPEAWDRFKSRESQTFGTTKLTEEGEGGKKQTNHHAGIEMEFHGKAAGTMTVGTSTGGSAFVPYVELVPGLVGLARNQPFIEQYANTSSTSSSRIVWVEKTNPQGQAAFIGEGDLKPLVSFEIKTNESTAKKLADKIKVSTEMLEDIDFIAGEIENELKYLVDIKVDQQLLSGDGTGNNLKGLTQYVGGYVLTTVKTTGTPNFADCFRAAVAQIRSLNFNANYGFINPIDAANMDLTKNMQGSYIIPPFQSSNGLSIAGISIVETNQMTVGQLLVGDMTKFIVRNYKPFAVQYGWVNDDFEHNLITIIGERRLHCYMADNNTGAFVFDSFTNIKTAITPAA